MILDFIHYIFLSAEENQKYIKIFIDKCIVIRQSNLPYIIYELKLLAWATHISTVII